MRRLLIYVGHFVTFTAIVPLILVNVADLVFVGSYLLCMFIIVLYMYAFAFSSLSMFLDMQYSPYSLLNAVSYSPSPNHSP
jgi:hypothetical protein